jgi:hypothetical protein
MCDPSEKHKVCGLCCKVFLSDAVNAVFLISCLLVNSAFFYCGVTQCLLLNKDHALGSAVFSNPAEKFSLNCYKESQFFFKLWF